MLPASGYPMQSLDRREKLANFFGSLNYSTNFVRMNSIETLHNLIKLRLADKSDLTAVQLDTIAAIVICEFYLGEDWARMKIESSLSSEQYEEDSLQLQNKIFRTGHYLYELRQIDNFSEMLNNLRKKEFESVFWELYSAHFFMKSGNKVEFVKQIGVKGRDFDLRVTNSQGRIYNVECKNRESIKTTTNTVLNAIRKAQDQFPKDEFDNVVHILVPELFIEQEVELDIPAFLISAERVKMVILTFWKWQIYNDAIVGYPRHEVISVQSDYDELPTRADDDGFLGVPEFTKVYRPNT